MTSNAEISLTGAKDTLESVVEKTESRIDRARRLYSVVERKKAANNYVAARDRARAASRILNESTKLLSECDRHRESLHDHVKAYPQIEGGVYHGHVQAYDEIQRQLTNRKQRIEMELAVIEHHYDVTASDQEQSRSWEAPYDTVEETLQLVTHVRRHDIPALEDAAENRDHTDTFQHPIQAFLDRLAILRKQMATVETIDHDAVATNATTVNGELAADYRGMVDDLHAKYTELENDLAELAAFVADAIDADDGPETDGEDQVARDER